MRSLFLCFLGIYGCSFLWATELITRLHSFEYATPELVERQIRQLVPEPQRVSVNADAHQVIVIADEQTHQKISSMLTELGRPPMQLQFHVRHNRDSYRFAVADAVPITLAVTQTPSVQTVEMARARLDPEDRELPVVGAALNAHVILLREDPPLARMRVTPAVIFGILAPYEVVNFPDLAMDFLIDTRGYVELKEKLSSHNFYQIFFQSQPDPHAAPRPVSLLLSFEGLVSEAPVSDAPVEGINEEDD
ncbi:hypothetical protein P3T73_07875 [Kiritimatiellota bacterium B12222]|nr:hypothetical protein P3T73_07875 [Kiritimatiellota bacterium B12222]